MLLIAKRQIRYQWQLGKSAVTYNERCDGGSVQRPPESRIKTAKALNCGNPQLRAFQPSNPDLFVGNSHLNSIYDGTLVCSYCRFFHSSFRCSGLYVSAWRCTQPALHRTVGDMLPQWGCSSIRYSDGCVSGQHFLQSRCGGYEQLHRHRTLRYQHHLPYLALRTWQKQWGQMAKQG